jgi:hypothetical protein
MVEDRYIRLCQNLLPHITLENEVMSESQPILNLKQKEGERERMHGKAGD